MGGNGKQQLLVAWIAFFGAVVGAFIGGIFLMESSTRPTLISISATQTAEAKLTESAHQRSLTPQAHTTPKSNIGGTEDLRICAYAWLATQPKLVINLDAALYRVAQSNGFGYAQSNEIPFQFNGQDYVLQDFQLGMVFARAGDWGNTRAIRKPISQIETSELVIQIGKIAKENTLVTVNSSSWFIREAELQKLGNPRTREFKFPCGSNTFFAQQFLLGIVFRNKKDGEIAVIPNP